MRRKNEGNGGSLEMLLDTMCNTFGGVCFMALMVAIISASLPAEKNPEADSEVVTEEMVVDKENSRLMRIRDELKNAIEIQKSFVASNSLENVRMLTMAQLESGIISNKAAMVRLQKEKVELEEALAKAKTDLEYNKREYFRLERLLKEMEETLGKTMSLRKRSVRTPVERELGGYKLFDVWLCNGRMYCLRNSEHVYCKANKGPKGMEWDYSIKPGAGYLMNDSFWISKEYRNILDTLSGKVYIRIFSDTLSFPELCNLRDDLIRHRKMYNWHLANGEVLHFVEGYDGRIQ